MNLKKIKDNNRKVRDGKLKNLALAGMMGLAGITGMTSCGASDSDDKDEIENIAQNNHQSENESQETSAESEVESNDPTESVNQEEPQTPTTKEAPKYLEKGEYNGYNINPRSIDIIIKCPTKEQALNFKANIPRFEVDIIRENTSGTEVCFKQDVNAEKNWDNIIKLMK